MTQPTLGATIAALRKERGMTQAELAEQLYVTDKAVSKWERGLSCPDMAALPKLAEALSVPLDTLMFAGGYAGATPHAAGVVNRMIGLVLNALAVAMGVAATALSILGEVDLQSLGSLLGIGLFCVSVVLLWERRA